MMNGVARYVGVVVMSVCDVVMLGMTCCLIGVRDRVIRAGDGRKRLYCTHTVIIMLLWRPRTIKAAREMIG